MYSQRPHGARLPAVGRAITCERQKGIGTADIFIRKDVVLVSEVPHHLEAHKPLPGVFQIQGWGRWQRRRRSMWG